MATLYELTAEYQSILEMAEDPEIDPDVLADSMEGLDYEIEEKADGYAKIIRQLMSDSEGYKAEISRLTARKQAVDNNITRMKQSLENAMIATNKRKFKTGLFSFNIQKNPASVVIDDESKIPDEYLIEQEPKIDNNKLKKDLKNGVDLQGAAHLMQTESIRIR